MDVDYVRRVSNDHWVVHVQGVCYSEVKVEVNLSRENARLLTRKDGVGVGKAVLALVDRALADARHEARKP